VLSFVTKALRAKGYNPIPAEDGQQGLERFKERRREIDLVLTDVSMPELSGPQMASKIKALKHDTRLMFMTGYSPGHVIPSGFSNNQVLRKPFTAKQLIGAIQHCLTGGAKDEREAKDIITD